MVNQRFPSISLWVIDSLGVGLVLTCAILFFWSAFMGGRDSSLSIERLQRDVVEIRQDGSRLRALRDDLRKALQTHQIELAAEGNLPREAPVDEYLHELAQLATRHAVEVRSQSPLPPRTYPGLVEHRHAYEVSGRFVDLVRWMRSVEALDRWADVGYWTISASNNTHANEPWVRNARFSISLFSAPSEPATSAGRS
ncbi:MAG: type 4a pilus biogenesis protein PilO [Planctomycetota bacterium]